MTVYGDSEKETCGIVREATKFKMDAAGCEAWTCIWGCQDHRTQLSAVSVTLRKKT